MKKLTLLLIIFFLGTSLRLMSQTEKDSLAIIQAAMDYIEGYYYSDVDRMERAIHPQVAKRVIVRDRKGNCFLSEMGSSLLVHITRVNENKNVLNPDAKLEANIEVFDIFENIASVKITTNIYGFIDYLHLGKFDGEWKIINVLWEPVPKKR